MNSWKFNAHASYHLTKIICNFFKIPNQEIYKKVKTIEQIDGNNILTTNNGEKYYITLHRIK